MTEMNELSRGERERILLGLRCRIAICVREHNRHVDNPRPSTTLALLAAYRADANEGHTLYNKLHAQWPDVRLPAFHGTPAFNKQEGA